MLVKISKSLKQKGQGIVEYALLLAFIVGIAMMLNGGGLANAVKDTFDNVAIVLGGDKYAPYFKNWHDKTSAWLIENASEKERLAADQEALAKIARLFINKNADQVKELIKDLSVNRNGAAQFNNLSNYMAVNDGWSNTLVPLSYTTNTLDNADGYIHLDYNGNVLTVQSLTNDVHAYAGNAEGNPYGNDAAVSDRIFYSNGMINSNGNNANDKMVTLQVHYDNGVVDQVNIQARNSHTNKNAQIVDGLNLNVTKTEINQISN